MFTPNFRRLRQICLILVMPVLLIQCTPPDNSSFYLISGEKKQLSDFRGQWVLVNFWAEWCRPCIEEVPDLNQLYDHQDDLNVALLAFSYDPVSNEQLIKAKEKYAIRYPIIATDPMPMVPFKRPNKLPAMILISPEGEVFDPVYGKQTEQSITNAINQLNEMR